MFQFYLTCAYTQTLSYITFDDSVNDVRCFETAHFNRIEQLDSMCPYILLNEPEAGFQSQSKEIANATSVEHGLILLKCLTAQTGDQSGRIQEYH